MSSIVHAHLASTADSSSDPHEDQEYPSDSYYADKGSSSRKSSQSQSRKTSIESDYGDDIKLASAMQKASRKSSLHHHHQHYHKTKTQSRRVSTAKPSASGLEDVASRIAIDLMELLKTTSASILDLPAADQRHLSDVEALILRSLEPREFPHATDQISVLGEHGLWLNKDEALSWRGVLPLDRYPVNEDNQPEVITKRSQQKLEYVQELAVRYLRPPTPPAPGEILITQEANELTPPAPPLIVRQQPARPATPEPLVIREAPPLPPPTIGRKLITISGKRLPPAPRKVVIERFAQLPAKPQSVLIERWLPYSEVKRRVIFRAAPPDPIVVKPRNIIVQWV